MIIAVIVLGVLVLALLAVVLRQQLTPKTDDNVSLLLKQDLTKLSDDITQLKDGVQKQMNDQMTASNRQIAQQSAASIKILQDVTEKLTKLEGTNKNVGDIANELKSLQNVLQNPKQRGVLGEFYLEQILKNTLPPGAFQLQYKIGPTMIVDAAIILDDKVLPVDSKFSLENYSRLLEAKPEEQDTLAKAFKEDLKRRIDETSKYILPGKGTLDQALMFIPSEAIYYDLLANKVGLGNVSGRNLVQYASEKKVTIVGPSTLSAMLQTIMQGLRSIEIHKDTEKIRKNIEQLSKHLIAHNAYMMKLGASLGTTVNHYNATYKELGKIDRDIVKITDAESSVDPLLLEKPTLED
ncbi:MAG TPA: DNA recombination protein RmuC [Candidatus Microsaccharimonas sp.]|nr:DNA recombination protein RmuC [Candidatus Microsaccharimonas sp.]